jgi:hypothetical protein
MDARLRTQPMVHTNRETWADASREKVDAVELTPDNVANALGDAMDTQALAKDSAEVRDVTSKM